MRRNRSSILSVTLLATSVSLCPAFAYAQNPAQLTNRLHLGAYFSQGDYGEDTDTEILYFPVSYEANYGPWGFQLTVPHLQVEGLGNVLVNVGGVTRAVAGTEVTRSRGVGDAIASFIYRTEPLSERAPFIDFRLDVKLPTADEDAGLGTGEADYSLQVDLSHSLENVLLFGTLGYSVRGKSDLFPGLEDSAYAQIGLARVLNDRLSAGVFYDFREPASNFTAETHELVPYVSWQLNDSWTFTGLTTFGFTDASADITVLGQLSYSW